MSFFFNNKRNAIRRNRDRAVATVTALRVVRIEAEARDYYNPKRMDLVRAHKPPIQCSLLALLSGLHRPGKKLGHLHISSAILKNNWSQCALLACTGIKLPLHF